MLAELEEQDDPPATPAELAAGRAAVTRAENDAATAERAARAVLADATAAAAAAPAAVTAARDRLAATTDAAAAANGAAAAKVTASQAALDSVRNGGPAPSPAALAAADADVAVARANTATTRVTGVAQVAEAEAAAARRGSELQEAEAMASSADAVAANANATRDLREQLAGLAADGLGTARRAAGVQLPADELLVVAAAPIHVQELLLTPGDPAVGPALVATNATVAVDGSVPTSEAGLLEVGMAVQIDEPSLGIAGTGTVSHVAETPGTNGVDGFHVYVEVLVDGNPATLPGTSVRLTIPVETTGDETLVVPVSAVSLASDGSSRVQVDRNGELVVVGVDVGLAAEGFVAVEPAGGVLEEGDLVAVASAVPGG